MKRRNTGFPAVTLELVTARSGGHCEIMARGCTLTAEQFHHRRPRGMGSTSRPETNYASNCLHLCSRCHLRVEAMRSWALAHGFLVSQRDDPAATPVWWRCVWHGENVKVLLDDSGGVIQLDEAKTQ